jgi:hypothetical protein
MSHPQEAVGGEDPKSARALPPQDDQLVPQGDESSSSDARLRNRNERKETTADRMAIIPPDRAGKISKLSRYFTVLRCIVSEAAEGFGSFTADALQALLDFSPVERHALAGAFLKCMAVCGRSLTVVPSSPA